MPNFHNTEDNRRRFDTGSGLSFELLNKDILKFVFHPLVRGKILKSFSGLVKEYIEGKKMILWIEEYGVAVKGDSDELVFLGANAKNIKDIYNSMKSSNIMGVLNMIESAIQSPEVSIGEFSKYPVADILNTSVANAVTEIGPKITICTPSDYSAREFSKFVLDHTSDPSSSPAKRAFSNYTKGTGQGKVITTSYYTGAKQSTIADSHPARIPEKSGYIWSQNYEGAFSLAKKYLALYKESDA